MHAHILPSLTFDNLYDVVVRLLSLTAIMAVL